MKIANNCVALFDYTLTDAADGTVIDSSEGQTPLGYIHGSGNIIPGLEREMEGKEVGHQMVVEVKPADGYGEFHEELVMNVPKTEFEGTESIEIGMQFHAQTPDGQQRVVTVKGVEDEHVIIDGNHPLAGVTLNFDVTIREVRDASAEELEHGHVHGEGGHQH